MTVIVISTQHFTDRSFLRFFFFFKDLMTLPALYSYLSLFSLFLYPFSALFMLLFCPCFCSFLFALAFSFSVLFYPLFYMLLLFLLLIFFYILIPSFFIYFYFYLFLFSFLFLFSIFIIFLVLYFVCIALQFLPTDQEYYFLFCTLFLLFDTLVHVLPYLPFDCVWGISCPLLLLDSSFSVTTYVVQFL